jgi:branched-subunit amino acid aminotransferase/4-amino-4-deoxychorismate lyase
MSVRVSATRRNTSSPLARIKSLNYLDNLLARAEAAEAGADEALLLDASGSVVEGAASNVFAVLDGTTTTPPISAGVLPGITRACVLELCQQFDLPVAESLFDLNTLRSADEAFLTNSLIEVMPLVAVNGQGVGTGVPGRITTRLQIAYRGLVSREAACE